jgi:hypothetical protein
MTTSALPSMMVEYRGSIWMMLPLTVPSALPPML